jgi:hypothetical protein
MEVLGKISKAEVSINVDFTAKFKFSNEIRKHKLIKEDKVKNTVTEFL